MKAHTPAPWHLNTLETVLHTVHANRGCVAEVSRGTMNEVSADEIEANARLIASAPELLLALEYAEDALDWYDNGENKQVAKGALKVIREAIALAKGKNRE